MAIVETLHHVVAGKIFCERYDILDAIYANFPDDISTDTKSVERGCFEKEEESFLNENIIPLLFLLISNVAITGVVLQSFLFYENSRFADFYIPCIKLDIIAKD